MDEAAQRAEHGDKRHEVISHMLGAGSVLNYESASPRSSRGAAQEIEADRDRQE